MKTIHLGSNEVAVQGSPWAAFLYGREFAVDGVKASWHDDYQIEIEKAEKPEFDDEGNWINYNKYVAAFDPMFLLKTAWSGAKTYDDSVPDFETWLKGQDCPLTAFAVWKMEVLSAIVAEWFRSGAQASDDDEQRSEGDGGSAGTADSDS